MSKHKDSFHNSDIITLLENRVAENDTSYKLQRDGMHVKGGINHTVSIMRHNHGLGLVYRKDLANYLDSWIVDTHESVRFYKQYVIDKDKQQLETCLRIFKSTAKTIMKCVYDIGSDYHVSKFKLDLVIMSLLSSVSIDNISMYMTIDYLSNMCTMYKTGYTQLSKGDVAGFRDTYHKIIDAMCKVFFEITTSDERKVYNKGDIL